MYRTEDSRALMAKIFGEETLKEKEFPEDWEAILMGCLEKYLSKRENDVIENIFEKHLSLEAIAEKYSVTKERIRQIELRAIHKLRGIPSVLIQGGCPLSDIKRASEYSDTYLERNVIELNLSTKQMNCLRRIGVTTIGDLIEFSRDDLLKIRNMGVKSVEFIEDQLEKLGYSLKKDL